MNILVFCVSNIICIVIVACRDECPRADLFRSISCDGHRTVIIYDYADFCKSRIRECSVLHRIMRIIIYNGQGLSVKIRCTCRCNCVCREGFRFKGDFINDSGIIRQYPGIYYLRFCFAKMDCCDFLRLFKLNGCIVCDFHMHWLERFDLFTV